MSLFKAMTVTCPSCGKSISVDAVGSVNADRRPDLRDEILAGTFQTVTCGECDEAFRLEPDFNYLDAGRGQWIAGMPASRMPQHDDLETVSKEAFDRSYGPDSSPAAQDIGNDLQARLVFGWPAMREKILIRDCGLDDEVIELLKIDLMRRLPEINLVKGVELRLLAVRDDDLEFGWINAETEAVGQTITVRRALYQEITGNPEGWATIAGHLKGGMFMDAQKLYVGV